MMASRSVAVAVGIVLAIVVRVAVPLQAHGIGEGLTEPRPGSPWDLLAIGLLCAVGVLYWRGSRRLVQRGAMHPARERGAFIAGWLALMA
jgi:hypothetical protein